MTPPDRDGRRCPARARIITGALCAAALLGQAGGARAADEDGRIEDVRMQVVEDPDADEGQYVDRIELPEAAAARDEPASRGGRERAREARERAGERGRETAREARELGDDARRPVEGPPAERPPERPGKRPEGGIGNRP